MILTAILITLLALGTVPRSAPPNVACVNVFATLTESQALPLAGKPARYLVEPDSLPGNTDTEGTVGYDCVGVDDLHRTVWLPAEPELVEDLVEIEAVLRVLHHKARDGFPGYTELRLERALLTR
jgi:hypothetical protein